MARSVEGAKALQSPDSVDRSLPSLWGQTVHMGERWQTNPETF
jgi:hypothetical protein